MEIIGKEIEFGIATEASRGTAETTADKWLRKVTANVVERATHAIDSTTRGRLEDGEGRRVVQKYIEGDIEGNLHVDVFGWLLGNVYGAVVTTEVVAATVYSHVFNLKQSIQHIALTLFAKDGGVQQSTFSNCMISTLSLSASVDEYIKFATSFVGSVSATNADTPSYDTEYDFISKDIVIKLAETEAGLTGATALKAKDVSIEWDAGVIRDHVVGSYEPDDNYNSKMKMSGSLNLNFADEVYKDYYLDDSDLYMSITITGSADLGSGNNPAITVLMNKVQFSGWNRDGGADELVTQSLEFDAFFNATDQKQSQVTIVNPTTAYTNVPAS